MATQLSDHLLERLDKSGVPKSKRKLQKHLRSAGLAYISRTGKVIPAKEVAAELCQCPHKCDANVPPDARRRLFDHFYGLGEADLQNQFLRRHMDLRARLNAPEAVTTTTPGGRPPRRITCKYLVPLLPAGDATVEVCQKAFVSAFVITTKRVRLQREKLIASLGLNSYSSHNRSKTSTTNNNNPTTTNNNPTPEPNNNTTVTDKHPPPPLPIPKLKIRLTAAPGEPMDADSPPAPPKAALPPRWGGRRSPKRRIDNPLIPFGLVVPEGVTICPVIATADHDRDIAIVNNFFSNQLWKPEYIGTYS